MTANYYTLAAIVRELRPLLLGATFEQAYSHRPNELRLHFDRGTLVAVLRPIDGALFFSVAPEQRPRTNAQSFFLALHGQSLDSIEISPTDREIVLGVGDEELRITFFGNPNAVRVAQGEPVEMFRKRVATAKSKATDSADSVPSGGTKLGKRYSEEAKLRGISDDVIERELLDSTHAIVYEREDTVLLSMIPLRSMAQATPRQFDSVNDAVRYVIIERGKKQRLSGLRRELLTTTDRDIERLERARSEMRKGSEDSFRAERHAAYANAILQHAHEIAKGLSSAELEVEERPTQIPLDPTLSAYENAAKYFERSRRARESKTELKERAASIATELAKQQARREAIVGADSLEALIQLKRPSSKEKTGDPAHSKFREYHVAGGMLVMVGRNAKQNDELTLHTAKKEDIWLHARGVPGSHVVLQVAGRKQVPKEAIVQAAEIAAYHSDAKTQSLAPVSYTQKKYVRKPKGADPGAVIVEREEVVMVTPRLPS
jgi:predicted ribosome quality control (RQC) complex YloA/Tae2 family protein